MPEGTTLGVLTSGGDAPGMNAAIWAACDAASRLGWRVLGLEGGWTGVLERRHRVLDPDLVLPWARRGGTCLGTSRLEDFLRHREAIDASLDALGIDRLLVFGGDGSLHASGLLAERRPVVAAPATIDNDIADSDTSIGFATAIDTALTQLDGMRDSAEALPRTFALETLGGDTGYLAAAVADAGGADLALVPEEPTPLADVIACVQIGLERRGYAVIVASEGYRELDACLEAVTEATGTRVRLSRLGHAQRGGRPNAADRILAHAFARHGVEFLAAQRSGRAVQRAGRIVLLPYVADARRRGAPVRR